MNLAKYSLDNTKVIYFFLAVLLLGGIFSFSNLGKKEDAPFVIKSAVIMTRYPGAEPAEVERLITEPISREIQSMSGVYKIKSESMYGISKITFELQPSLAASSIPQKWDELRRKVLNIQPQLPNGASVPTVSDDFGDVFGIYYGLTADDGFTYEEMRDWAERIKTQVVTANGVMKVALFGVQTEVINIFISVNKLVGMGIDPKQLASLLQSQNQIINTGEIQAGEQQLRVVANGMYSTVNDIRSPGLSSPGAVPVLLCNSRAPGTRTFPYGVRRHYQHASGLSVCRSAPSWCCRSCPCHRPWPVHSGRCRHFILYLCPQRPSLHPSGIFQRPALHKLLQRFLRDGQQSFCSRCHLPFQHADAEI